MKTILTILVCICILGCKSHNYLAASNLTVDQGIEIIKKYHKENKEISTDEFQDKINTIPVLLNDNEFHWVMKDGHIWTKFESQKNGKLIIKSYTSEKTLDNNTQEFAKQMTYFYKQPTEKNFIKFQKNAELNKKLFSSNNNAKLLVSIMIARIAQKYNWPIIQTSFSKMAEEVIANKTKLARFVNDDKIVNPTKLDIWWGSFFATGEIKYLNNIFEYTGKNTDEKENIKDIIIYRAADWSFKSNCKQHQKVLNFAEKQLNNSNLSDFKRQYLKECIRYAKSK